ncbi:lycopene cyclase domain-containing protein [Desulfatibacillum aliphaticivorans]|uniref:lycopene cyclase domain-containing protein n=1 Tax=Desulfatibacillum aliphaticivorans TaxID=218208 RepID=UPI00040BF4F1|nr:lycopene cyclase domain-containing protein [Desulfatibacillum aliphaticivorans]
MQSNCLYQYYYLWSVALLVPFWALILYKKKTGWEEIIYIGILAGAGAMFFDRYVSFRDYWHPQTISDLYNFESFLYGFFYGGISAKIYEVIARVDYAPARSPRWLPAAALVLVNAVVFVTMMVFVRLNSVENFMAMLAATTALLLIIRPDLVKVCAFSGLIMLVFNLCWYWVILLIYPDAFKDIWSPAIQKGPMLFKIPLLEHGFILAVGCSSPLLYKVVASSRLASQVQFEEEGEAPSLTRKILDAAGRFAVPIAALAIVLFRMIVFGTTPIRLKKLLSFFL